MRPLYLDIDDCTANCSKSLRGIIKAVTGGHVDLGYEDIVSYNYTENVDRNGRSIDTRTWDEAHDIFSTAEVITKLDPLPGAVAAIKELQEVFDVHFITTRLHQARVPTVQWLDSLNLGPYSVHFVERRKKHEAASDSVVAAVEDDPVQAELYWRKGIKCLVPARPWNTSIAPENRYDGWGALLPALKRLA